MKLVIKNTHHPVDVNHHLYKGGFHLPFYLDNEREDCQNADAMCYLLNAKHAVKNKSTSF